jgi:hypothetical protein
LSKYSLQVSDFFAKLIQRVSPKSYQQALAEVQVSQKFLENFCGDQVFETLFDFFFGMFWRLDLFICMMKNTGIHESLSISLDPSSCSSGLRMRACSNTK